MDPLLLIVIIIYVLNLLTVLELIFFEKRSYNSFLVWVLILVLVPVLGFFVYFIFGKGPSIGKKNKFLHKIDSDEDYYREVELQKKLLSSDIGLDDSTTQLAYYNLLQQSSIITDNNELEIMTDIDKMYKKMIEDIKDAKKYVNILFFIIKNDEYGKALRDILIKKAKEGIKVRLIYDHVGSSRLPYSFFKNLKKAGGEVYRFLPSIFKLFFRNVNYRNHRKIVVVDGRIAYTGSANVGEEYANKSKRIKPWHDTQIRIMGNAVNLINLRFMQDYNFTAKTPEVFNIELQESAGEKIMQIISSGPDSRDEKIKDAYIKAIYAARKKVYIQTPYFIPDESFQLALITAVKSGVDVRIMIPGVPDKRYAYLVTTYYMKELLPYGVKFYFWKGFMHSKTLIIDDEIVSIGTFNIDIRSFKLHFEMTVFIYNKQTNNEITKRFLQEQENSKLVPPDYKGTRLRRFLEKLMRLFTPLM